MNTSWYEILMIAMLAISFYACALDLIAISRKLQAPARTERPIESVSPPIAATTPIEPLEPSHSVEGSYREAPLRPSTPNYDERLESSKLRPFVCGQTVLVRLKDTKGEKPEFGPWFTATFEGFTATGGYTFIFLKNGTLPTPSQGFLQCQTEMLHPEDSTK